MLVCDQTFSTKTDHNDHKGYNQTLHQNYVKCLLSRVLTVLLILLNTISLPKALVSDPRSLLNHNVAFRIGRSTDPNKPIEMN